ncbi:hypothetical protein DENSPDRAFT_668535 [Dentipellis sp. KUC8613]|nr:hypothetical protein DENSPDRAFT_668535 [Dentipellis sp. KUC8613]
MMGAGDEPAAPGPRYASRVQFGSALASSGSWARRALINHQVGIVKHSTSTSRDRRKVLVHSLPGPDVLGYLAISDSFGFTRIQIFTIFDSRFTMARRWPPLVQAGFICLDSGHEYCFLQVSALGFRFSGGVGTSRAHHRVQAPEMRCRNVGQFSGCGRSNELRHIRVYSGPLVYSAWY